jgi:hypothetical protein
MVPLHEGALVVRVVRVAVIVQGEDEVIPLLPRDVEPEGAACTAPLGDGEGTLPENAAVVCLGEVEEALPESNRARGESRLWTVLNEDDSVPTSFPLPLLKEAEEGVWAVRWDYQGGRGHDSALQVKEVLGEYLAAEDSPSYATSPAG